MRLNLDIDRLYRHHQARNQLKKEEQYSHYGTQMGFASTLWTPYQVPGPATSRSSRVANQMVKLYPSERTQTTLQATMVQAEAFVLLLLPGVSCQEEV